MRKNSLILTVIILLSIITSSTFAAPPQIQPGLTWLNSAQTTTGNWPQVVTSEYHSTAAALDAAYALEPTSSTYTTGLAWLGTQIVSPTDYLSRRIIALKRAGQDVSNDVNSLLLYRNVGGGWGGDAEYQNDIIDTALALQALKAANYSDASILYQAINYLAKKQNTDGGWGFRSSIDSADLLSQQAGAIGSLPGGSTGGTQPTTVLIPGDPSNTYVTAATLRALAAFSSQFGVQSSVSKATAYLLTKQNTDGGFGSSPSTIYETALSILSFIESGQGSSTALQNGINYLTTTQASNGSWNDDPYSTALALQALANVRPNLAVASLIPSKAMPRDNETVTITATVNNTGLENAANVIVRFYNGDPALGGTQIGTDQVLPLVARGSSSQVSIPQSFIGTGSRTIFVVVDPDNFISETSKLDNKASTRLWVATGSDLAIYSEDLKTTSSMPRANEPFTLTYTVRNLGETDTDAFVVSLYDGNPSSGGLLLTTANISGLPGTQTRTGTMGVTLTSNGPHTLYLVADSGNQITEISKTNNTGAVSVNVGATDSGADLAVTQPDITLMPSRPHAGDTVQISARVRNQGAAAAFGFTVEFYDNAPEAGGVLINTQSISLAANADQIITANWTAAAGIHTLYAIVDRQNVITEMNKNNNRSSVLVMPDMVDIALSATDLAFTPSHPVINDTVALAITVRNAGIIATNAFNFALYDGDPASGGVLLQTFPISSIAGDGSATITYTFTAVPKTYRFYAVADTENVVIEMSETNNTAIRSLKIKAPGEILGPDLVPIKIELTDTTTDPQTLAISGTAHVTVQNKGDDKITTSFSAIIFEDKDNDAKYTTGVDNLLGTGTLATGPTTSFPAIWPEGANVVDVPLSGTVKFLHAPMYAMVDSGDAILEQNETNNVMISCKDCQVVPTNPIQPVLKWKFSRPAPIGVHGYTPAVAPLIDTNGDNRINEADTPVLFFVSHQVVDQYNRGRSRIHAVRGDTGEELFSIFDSTQTFANISAATPVVADIDNDGKPEIIVKSDGSGIQGFLYAYDNSGNLKWNNLNMINAYLTANPGKRITIGQLHEPTIADLDGDGIPEIILGSTAFNGDGTVKWAGAVIVNNRWVECETTSTYVADIDLDGRPEVLCGSAAFNWNGTLKWWNQAMSSANINNNGIAAIGNFNDDPYPEIVFLYLYKVYLLDHNGNVLWGPVNLNQVNNWTSNPIIADIDGDNESEIGIEDYGQYFFLDKNGAVKSTIPSGGGTSSGSVFDLNGDGRPEVLITGFQNGNLNGAQYFSIFDGKSGSLLFRDSFKAEGSFLQNVIVSDVDHDGHAEIVAFGQAELRVYGSSNNDWVNARSVWNQPSYHVTNVNDDGSIPKNEAPSWLLNNTYRTQAAIGPIVNPYLTPNLTASYLRALQNASGVHMTVRIGNGGAKEAAIGATVTFYDGNPTSGTIIGTASTTKVLQIGDYEDISFDWKGGSAGVHDIYAVVNDCSNGSNCSNRIPECNYDDNQIMVSMTVQGPGTIFGPDLIPLRLDVSSATTDPVTLSVSGTARVTLQNTGDAPITTPFTALVFEDIDGDGRYTQGVDIALGTGTNTHTLLPNGAFIVEVPLTGRVAYVGAMLSAMVDSGDAISEQNENNNVLRAASACEARPLSPIQPVVKWKKPWDGMIYMPPVVANLTDHNGDGKIDTNDAPDIAYITMVTNPINNQSVGKLSVVRGDTGATVFSVFDLNRSISYSSSIAVGDIDNDGFSEIIVQQRSNLPSLFAYAHDGTLKWDNQTMVTEWNQANPNKIFNSPYNTVIADLDGDGSKELILGPMIFNSDGSVRCSGYANDGTYNTGIGAAVAGAGASSIVADLDLDGKQEIIAGNTAYNADCTVKWWNKTITDGNTAVGNLNGEPYPEIVLVTSVTQSPHVAGGRVYLLDHNGNVKWGPVYLNTLEPNNYSPGSPPVIADFDGDGELEIGIQGMSKFFILDKNGNLKQTLSRPYASGGTWSAATVFDLNGDGSPEVMMNNEGYLRIFDGKTGMLLYSEIFGGTGNNFQNVVVADVDGDGHAEVIAVGMDPYRTDGIRVYGSRNNDWASARKVWNQTSYHVTNVNDDGSIPKNEAPSWLLNNTYLCQAGTGVVSNATGTNYSLPNLTASYLRATYDGSGIDMLVRVANSGAKDAPAGVIVTFYDGAPAPETIIGTVSITKMLRPGEYQDIAYSITSATLGVHHLYAVVDAANTVSECRKDDNQVQFDYTVQATYPDLTIRTEEISLPTGTIYEGNLVPITVNVRNIGAVSADNVNVRLYNGNPASGGTPAGTDQYISSLSSGATTTLVFTYDTLTHGGANVLYVVADPAAAITETNKANNMASVSLNVQLPVLPDLAVFVNNIQVAPIAPTEGDGVIITTTITNRGAATGNIPVKTVVSSQETGVSREVYSETKTIYPVLSLGQTATIQTIIPTAGLAGQMTILVAVDPMSTIFELSRDNNIATTQLFIQSAGLATAVALNKQTYQANELVNAAVTITNTKSEARSLTPIIVVKDNAGYSIATISTGTAVTVNANSSITLTHTWNTGATLAGNYLFATELTEGTESKVISKATASFSINAEKSVEAKVVTDKINYEPNQTATLTSTITSRSTNTIMENLVARITINSNSSNGSNSPIHTETKAISTLMPNAAFSFKTYWNTGTYAAGSYPVTLEVRDASNALISTATQNLVISSTVRPSYQLRGAISVDKQSIMTGETVTTSYSVTNIGNLDLSDVAITVLTINTNNLAVYNTLASQATLTMGSSYQANNPITALNYPAKDYLVVLRAKIGDIEETLAGTYLRVEGAPTAPSLLLPTMGSDVDIVTPLLTVNNASDPNDDRLTYEFELYADSGLTQLIGSSGLISEATSTTSWIVPVTLTENSTYYWRARAYDTKLYGAWMDAASFRVNNVNDPPSAPILSSPINNGIVSSLTPTLTVMNATDPDSPSLTYNFDLALDANFTQLVAQTTGVSSQESGVTSWQTPGPLTENMTYYWRAQADDWLIDGPWSTTGSFFVNTVNNAPSIPVITAPTNGASISATSIDIVLANSTDPDSPSLTYAFELDTVMSFDTATIMRSGNIQQGQNSTIWHVSGLIEDTQYYVRAKASDGQAESAWSGITGFFISTTNSAPTAPTLNNPGNNAGVNVFMPTLSVQNATDPDRDALTYQFELYADAALTSLVTVTTGVSGQGTGGDITSWTVPVTLTENQTYYWRTRANDGSLNSPWMTTAAFFVNTANDAPGAPVLLTPTDGSTVTTLTPVLTITNATDPDNDPLTYEFEVYGSDAQLVAAGSGIPAGGAGIPQGAGTTSWTVSTALTNNTVYTWRVRAYDGDRYGPWTAMASFTTHISQTSITVDIDFEPETLNKKDHGKWVLVKIELPHGYKAKDVDISSIRLEGTVHAELWPHTYHHHHHKHGCHHDRHGHHHEVLMVKFKRSEVIAVLPEGKHVPVHVTGTINTTLFEGVDVIRVISDGHDCDRH